MAKEQDTKTDNQPAPAPAADPVADPKPSNEPDNSEFDAAFAEHSADPETDEDLEPDLDLSDDDDPKPEPDTKSDPEPAPNEDPEDPEDPAAAAGSKETTPDIWADAKPEQKAAYEAAATDAHKWRSDSGRAAADRRRIQELEQQLSAKSKGAADAAPGDNAVMQVLEGDAWKTVEKELPELAAPLKEILTASANENAALHRRLATFDESHADEVAKAQLRIVEQAHPDWEAVTNQKEFAEWVVTQPPFVQQMLHRNGEKVVDGDEAAHLVSLYKSSPAFKPPSPPPNKDPEPAPNADPSPKPDHEPAAGKTAAPSKTDRTRQRRLEANTRVPPSGPGASSQPPDDFESAFEHYASAG